MTETDRFKYLGPIGKLVKSTFDYQDELMIRQYGSNYGISDLLKHPDMAVKSLLLIILSIGLAIPNFAYVISQELVEHLKENLNKRERPYLSGTTPNTQFSSSAVSYQRGAAVSEAQGED